MSTSVRDYLQQTALQVEALGDIDQAITTGVRQRTRTLAVATAVAVAAVVVLAAIVFSNPFKAAAPEPLQPPTPTPQADAKEFRGHFPPGDYAVPGRGCYSAGSWNRLACVLYVRSGSRRVWVSFTFSLPYGSGAQGDVYSGGRNTGDGAIVDVAGYEGVHRTIDDRHEKWIVDIERHKTVIRLSAEAGANRAVLTEAHAIIDSTHTELTNTGIGFRLVFTLTSNHWKAG